MSSSGRGFAQAAVDALRAQAAARHEQHGLRPSNPASARPARAAAAEQLRPGGVPVSTPFLPSARAHSGKVAATLVANRAQMRFARPGSEIAFMAYGGHAAQPRTKHHRHAHKAALGEAHIRLQAAHERDALKRAPDHPEGVGEVLHAEVAAKLAAFDGVDR